MSPPKVAVLIAVSSFESKRSTLKATSPSKVVGGIAVSLLEDRLMLTVSLENAALKGAVRSAFLSQLYIRGYSYPQLAGKSSSAGPCLREMGSAADARDVAVARGFGDRIRPHGAKKVIPGRVVMVTGVLLPERRAVVAPAITASVHTAKPLNRIPAPIVSERAMDFTQAELGFFTWAPGGRGIFRKG